VGFYQKMAIAICDTGLRAYALKGSNQVS